MMDGDDLVERLNEDFSVNAREDIQNQMKVYESERKEAADRIEQIKELYLEYVDLAEERAARIEQLEAALDDVATHLPRAEWHYLKDETLITIGEKKDGID
jgi:hypothetical protein